MTITVLFGNGFDLKAGLNTEYKDFYKYYIKYQMHSEYKNASNYKAKIASDFQYWSKLEEGIGEFAHEFGEDTNAPIYYLYFYLDMVLTLSSFLQIQNNMLHYCDFNGLSHNFLHNIIYFPKYMQNIERKRANYREPHRDDNVKLNLIVFNYTETIDKILSHTDGDRLPFLLDNGHYCYIDIRLSHIHGLYNSNLVFGLCSPDQIFNKTLSRNKNILTTMIKQNANTVTQNDHESIFEESIDESDYVLIYGMSLGKTDSNRWSYILNKMISQPNLKVVIFEYGKETDLIIASTLWPRRENIRKRFYLLAIFRKTSMKISQNV